MPAAPVIRVSPPALLQTAATTLVDAHRDSLPDLRDAVVLLPALNAASGFARAVSTAAATPALILPRITTLARLAGDVTLAQPVLTHTSRQAMLYRVLVERGWLKGADLFSVAAELALLFDELTRSAVELPHDLRTFTQELERAYRARPGAALAFEARLVHELWHAALADGAALDPQAAYHMRLAKLADELSAPVYAIGLEDLGRSEELFLARAAARVGLTRFVIDRSAAEPVTRTVSLAWPEEADHADLLTRSRALASALPVSALQGRLRIFAAANAEQEAQAVDLTVREWLLEGRKEIAVIVNDRLTARRARALLERAEVLVEDEAGWAFSTTSAATVIGRWLDIAANDAYHRDLLDLMKSPFAFYDVPRESRLAAVWRLEGYARGKSVVSGLHNFIALAEARGDREVVQMLKRVEHGLATLGRGRRPIARWLSALLRSLSDIGVAQGLADDSAGAQLLELTERLEIELDHEPLAIPFSELRRFLARELESATYRDRAIQSPVVFTHLAAAPARRFDAVLLLGCDAAHLPGPDPTALFFNQAVRAELGLPNQTERIAKLERELANVIACADTAMVTWQCRSPAGEANLLSPQLERLVALHRLAYGGTLDDAGLASRLPLAQVRYSDAAMPVASTVVPRPSVPGALVPLRISASAYATLMSCPYQFYARYALGLGELDEVQEEMEKRDYGELVHAVLSDFHHTHPRVSNLAFEEACTALETLSVRAFAGLVSRNFLERAWLVRWLALIPEYVSWQCAREREGWSWHAGELAREIEIVTPGGRRLILYGRLDRVDLSGAGGVAVIDYKTQRREMLSAKLKLPGEDVQLPAYALLWGAPVEDALFLSLERDGVRPVPIEEALAELSEAARLRLADMYDALHGGAPLSAQGVEPVCQYCEVRGLCRRNYWP